MKLLKTLRGIAATTAIAGTAMLMPGGGAYALDEAAHLKLGEIEYMSNCAACHGADAKGAGPVAEVLSQKPSDLPQISKAFGGQFPVEHIYHVVDGRNMINPHGDRQMPVWGHRYFAAAAERAAGVPHDVDAQAMAHGRIMALVQYRESIQAE